MPKAFQPSLCAINELLLYSVGHILEPTARMEMERQS
jgi:hypothetical protein